MRHSQRGFIDPNYKGGYDEPDLPRPPMTKKDRVILLVIALTSLAISISGIVWVYGEAAKVIGRIIY
jgi:hypothetical protein